MKRSYLIQIHFPLNEKRIKVKFSQGRTSFVKEHTMLVKLWKVRVTVK